ncbi:hypothetical protein BU26DRAFT_323441 [Trematosphaeria pertusa]|uniref:Uncharacterized protein n=1 Tax=Trematosphaeria pertusa TaxID=390896 RepID=A0A6A6ICJ3_9PLEO|nr:uncharacterized protein BU26DRAFT_323441 [Trematosphaeria pertusa]KAF2247927.1 hypothetical protein BU26DRAFT_323441 [Trematosphaeria pertusa]
MLEFDLLHLELAYAGLTYATAAKCSSANPQEGRCSDVVMYISIIHPCAHHHRPRRLRTVSIWTFRLAGLIASLTPICIIQPIMTHYS